VANSAEFWFAFKAFAARDALVTLADFASIFIRGSVDG